MAELVQELVIIDQRLRFAFFGLECVLGVSFDGAECERVFRDAVDDMVSSKEYVFYRSSRLVVSGAVGAYEPGEIVLRVEGRSVVKAMVKGVIEGAGFHAYRMRNAAESRDRTEPDGELVSDNKE